jgi:hypothetical protein
MNSNKTKKDILDEINISEKNLRNLQNEHTRIRQSHRETMVLNKMIADDMDKQLKVINPLAINFTNNRNNSEMTERGVFGLANQTKVNLKGIVKNESEVSLGSSEEGQILRNAANIRKRQALNESPVFKKNESPYKHNYEELNINTGEKEKSAVFNNVGSEKKRYDKKRNEKFSDKQNQKDGKNSQNQFTK